MSYELAKQLKDAGFPYRWCPGFDADTAEPHDCSELPTLSELIEACGLGRFTLERNEDGQWEACHVKATPMCYYSATPEEAVARLWLALNSKKI